MEISREMPGPDPDLVLIRNYLAGDLAEDAAGSVEIRLAEDDAFFEKVWPTIHIWTSPRRTPVPSTLHAIVTEPGEPVVDPAPRAPSAPPL